MTSMLDLFPIRHPNKIPVVRVFARDARTGKRTSVPVSLSLRFPGVTKETARQPLGFERVLIMDRDQIPHSYKGAGQRDELNTCFSRSGAAEITDRGEILKPFGININPIATTHLLIGGADYNSIKLEFCQNQSLLRMLRRIGASPKNLPTPIAIYTLTRFPVIHPDGKIEYIPTESYFMNPKYFTSQQKLAILNYLSTQASAECQRIAAQTKKHLDKNNRRAARLFAELYKPVVYEYAGSTAPRIGQLAEIIFNDGGTLRDTLIEQGKIPESAVYLAGTRVRSGQGISFEIYEPTMHIEPGRGLEQVNNHDIKEVLDKMITELYRSAGLDIVPPPKTSQDLSTTKGRLKYLKEIRALNSEAARILSQIFCERAATQLGTIHGSGGHAGGAAHLVETGCLHFSFTDAGGLYYIMKNEFSSCIHNTDKWHKKDGDKWLEEAPPPGAKLTLIRIANEGGGTINLGPNGGGSTRQDNVSIAGLADFDTLCLQGEDPEIETLIPLHSNVLTNSTKRKNILRYFYLKSKQQADLGLLFWNKPRRTFFPSAGTFIHFIALTGGDLQDYFAFKDQFFATYKKWHGKARRSLAPTWLKAAERANVSLSPSINYFQQTDQESAYEKRTAAAWL
ncbi:hypothetical protein HZB07_03805 [Candidatus Saganbacteria bacterium]|nr:hypothetical protein [Candidatus Saganbacteria bacterium]